MPLQDPIFEMKLQFPRRIVQIMRKRYPANTIEESCQQAFDELCAQVGPGVHISEKTMRELETILACQQITSEDDLIAKTATRFSVSPTEVLVDIDPTLCYYIREVAENEKISFREAVINFFHHAFAQGWFNMYQSQSWVCFSQKEWKRLKELLATVPATGTNILRILEDWKVRREAVPALQPPVQTAPPMPSAPPKKEPAAAVPTF
jgi:hypothetical protein